MDLVDINQESDGRTLGSYGGIGDSQSVLPNLSFERESGAQTIYTVLDHCVEALRQGSNPP